MPGTRFFARSDLPPQDGASSSRCLRCYPRGASRARYDPYEVNLPVVPAGTPSAYADALLWLVRLAPPWASATRIRCRGVAIAFQRAFDPSSANGATRRPTASEWIPLLENMEKEIIECRANSAHYYSRTARAIERVDNPTHHLLMRVTTLTCQSQQV